MNSPHPSNPNSGDQSPTNTPVSAQRNAQTNLQSSAHAAPEPAQGSASDVAGELFTHGLLTYLHDDTASAQSQRVSAALRLIDADGRDRSVHGPSERAAGRLVLPRLQPYMKPIMAMAASLVLVGAVTLLVVPTASTASATVTVQASISAMRSGGDRRYEVRALHDDVTMDDAEPIAVVDTRAPNLLVLRGRSPDGRPNIAGRDANGLWGIRPDGVIDRDTPRRAWPRWSNLGQQTLFADSVDALLDEMTKGYTLERRDDQTRDGRTQRHIIGTKKDPMLPGAQTIDIWIDPASQVVERLELHFVPPPQGMRQPGLEGDDRGPGPGGRRGPGGGPGDDRGERGGRGERGEPREPGERGDRPGPDDRGPRPGRRGPGGPDRDRGPGGPGGPDGPEGRPDHDRPFPPPFPGPREGGPRGSEDRGGPGGPEGRGGPGGRGHNPPKTIILQRVNAPAFDASWFSPEAHMQGASQQTPAAAPTNTPAP